MWYCKHQLLDREIVQLQTTADIIHLAASADSRQDTAPRLADKYLHTQLLHQRMSGVDLQGLHALHVPLVCIV